MENSFYKKILKPVIKLFDKYQIWYKDIKMKMKILQIIIIFLISFFLNYYITNCVDYNLYLNEIAVNFQNPKTSIIIVFIKLWMFKFINIYHFYKKIKNYLKIYTLYYIWFKSGIRTYVIQGLIYSIFNTTING